MPIKIKSQTDYLVTEVAIELPADLNALESLMKTSRGKGKIVGTYNEGGVLGVTMEQRTRVPERVSAEVRELIGVGTKEMNGHKGTKL